MKEIQTKDGSLTLYNEKTIACNLCLERRTEY